MVFSLFKRKTRPPGREKACLPEGLRIYAIGDIHGRLDLLEKMVRQVAADLQAANYDTALTIFLGDYIDRGYDSAGVLARLSRRDFPTPFVALRGNHEQMLLDFLEDETQLGSWRLYGGLQTLHSFNIDLAEVMRGKGFEAARDELLVRLPAKDLQFVGDTKSHYVVGDYFFCHAGTKPGIALEQQNWEDLMWIRDEFLKSDVNFGKIIVHGHSPVPEPEIHPNRINIDTGAFATSKLTCLVLQGSTQRFLFTGVG
jgi:serine/threonine protein phosphatase 1